MIPVNEPLITEKEVEYVTDALQSGWISSDGKYIKLFEEKFANYVGRKYGITVNNGTSALIIAIQALDLPKGSEIIIPSFTIISCALACVMNDLVPVFIDSDAETWNMDLDLLEEKITSQTKAIMLVHIYGHPMNMDRSLEIAKKYNLKIIEDFAEAIGSEFNGIRCGGFGDVSCASFYANKVITTGEGGMCLTNDPVIAARLKKLKNLAFEPDRRFVHYELSSNYRMTNIQAAIGLAQTERVQEHVNKKIWIAQRYNELLQPLLKAAKIQLPIQQPWALNTYWMYGIVLNKELGIKASDIMTQLAEGGIQTRPFFYPMHMQPAFETMPWYNKQSLPVSEWLYEYGFYMPSGLTLTEEQIKTGVNTLTKLLS